MRIDPRKLMQFYDGELDSEQAEAVWRQLARDREAQRVLAEYAELSQAIGIWAQNRDRERASAAIAKPHPTRKPRAVAKPHAVVRRAFGVAWVGAAAAAALMALVATHSGDSRSTALGSSVAQLSPSRAGLATASVGSAPSDDGTESTGAAIEAVDFGAGAGTIFMVSKGAQATPVVWLSDDDESSDEQTQPL